MADVKFKPAKVTLERKRFMLTVGKTKKEIAVGELNDAASVKRLAGKDDVVAAVSGRTIVAIGRRLPGKFWILCYVPAPDVFRRILPEIRQQLVRKYVDEQVIDRGFAEELNAGF
jgi:hypothetical protein